MEDPRISQQDVAQPLSGAEALPVVQQSINTGKLRTLRSDVNALKDYLVKDFINALYPTGAIIPYASNIVDDTMGSWLLCDGRSISQKTYPRLFNVIGKTYGSVDSDSFNVPNLKGRSIVGYCDVLPTQIFNFGRWDASSSISVGSKNGVYNVKLQKSNAPLAYTNFPSNKFVSTSNAARYVTTTRSYSVGETNGTVSDVTSVDSTYEYYAAGGRTSSNCKSGSNSTTITYTLDGSSQSISVKNGTYRFVLFAYISNKTYYRVLDESDSALLINSNSSVVDFSNPAFTSLFDIQKFKEVGSASCSVVSQSRKSGPCYGGMSGSTYVILYKQQPTMNVLTANVVDNLLLNTTQPYMVLNYIIKY